MPLILYYFDEYDAQHRIPLGEYNINDAQALINLALERKQVVTFTLAGRNHELDMRTAKRVIILDEAYEDDVLHRVDEADLEAGNYSDDDEEEEDNDDSEDDTHGHDTNFQH